MTMTKPPKKNAAAQALRAIPSEKRAAASRENGKKGGRPKGKGKGRERAPKETEA